MSVDTDTPVSLLGLGAMGSALAEAVLKAGHPTTVWNRTAGKAAPLVAVGATGAGSVAEAVRASSVVIACLLDADSVSQTLGPVAEELRGKTLVNVTTTSPQESRQLAEWAAAQGIDYLDGGIMAVPGMIGGPGSSILYSGSNEVFEKYKPLLDLWGGSDYFGTDAGMASLYDLALLAGMYVLFAGFFQGAAMVATEGVSATEFAGRAVPWLTAMTQMLPEYAKVVDGGDYKAAAQSLDFSDLSGMVAAAEHQGVGADMIAAVQAMIRRQIEAGHGSEGFERIYESLRHPNHPETR